MLGSFGRHSDIGLYPQNVRCPIAQFRRGIAGFMIDTAKAAMSAGGLLFEAT
ncbi:hypothetical protein X756_00835 [Mesorhizobium sp. LSHC412B00]|nr:hypothetical protein X756_00835 [Mesorhizobium sp. LSHC412B00]